MAKWRKGTPLTSKALAISAGRQFFGTAVGENPSLRGFWMEQAANLKKSGPSFELNDIFEFVYGNLARAPKTQRAWMRLIKESKGWSVAAADAPAVAPAVAPATVLVQPSTTSYAPSSAVVPAPGSQEPEFVPVSSFPKRYYEQKWFLPTVGGVTLLFFALIAFTPKRK